MTATGPCLVELNSRVNGAAGAWIPLARALTGYTQVDATVDAFLNGEAGTPGRPGALRNLPGFGNTPTRATDRERERESQIDVDHINSE